MACGRIWVDRDGQIYRENALTDDVSDVPSVGLFGYKPKENGRTSVGWLAKLIVNHDPAASLEIGGGIKYEFLKPLRVSVGVTQRMRQLIYAPLPDGVYAARCGAKNAQNFNVYLKVSGSKFVQVSTDRSELRPMCGLPPLEEVRKQFVEGVALDNRLPPLSGTEKQVAWANRLRAMVVNVCPGELLPALMEQTSSRWWIDCYEAYSIPKYDSYGAYYVVYSACCQRSGMMHERIGRTLANMAYESVENTGEVLRSCTTEPRWPGPDTEPILWNLIVSNLGLICEPSLAAYRARWSELLSYGSVMVKEDPPQNIAVCTKSEMTLTGSVKPGSVMYVQDTGDAFVATVSRWKPIFEDRRWRGDSNAHPQGFRVPGSSR